MHPQRSIITRALGVDSSVDVDVYPVELVPGDRSSSAPTASPAWCSPTTSPPRSAARPTPRAPRRSWSTPPTRAGGEDNITVVVVAVTDEAPLRGACPNRSSRSWPSEVDDDARTGARASGAGAARAASGGCCCGRCRSSWCSASRSARSVGTRARTTTWAASQGQVTVFKGVPGGLAGLGPDHRAAHHRRRRRPAARPTQAQVPRPPDVLVARRRRRRSSHG